MARFQFGLPRLNYAGKLLVLAAFTILLVPTLIFISYSWIPGAVLFLAFLTYAAYWVGCEVGWWRGHDVGFAKAQSCQRVPTPATQEKLAWIKGRTVKGVTYRRNDEGEDIWEIILAEAKPGEGDDFIKVIDPACKNVLYTQTGVNFG